jgi:hypothetical protein
MKLDEFKAWFEGFTEGMEGAPTAKQWKRIKERVAEIDGVAISYPVYVERYVRPWYPYWNTTTAGGIVGPTYTANMASNSMCMQQASQCLSAFQDGQIGFDGASAMFAAGKAEAASFNA